jgi:hypothetical protein
LEGHEDDVVHLSADEKLKHVALQIQFVRRVAEHEVVAVLTRAQFRYDTPFRHERVVDIGNDQAEQLRFLHDHGARKT